MNSRLHEGTELVTRLPDTLAALAAGTITHRHAACLVEAVTHLDDTTATQVEARVLPRAGAQTPAAFRRCVRRAVLAADPADTEARHRRSLADRRVCTREVGDGMGELWALLPLDGIATIMTALHADAARAPEPGDQRTADQRRADTLVALATATLTDPTLPQWQGRRPSVQVIVNASTLLGLDDDPAEIDGHGPIPATLARHIAADTTGTWRRILTDKAGHLLDASRTYRPPAALTHHIQARDRHCRFPHCPRTARRCELDHQHPWHAGGPTTPDNLESLCPRHHHLKHEAGWTVTGNPHNTLTWTSPTGHTYQAPLDVYE